MLKLSFNYFINILDHNVAYFSFSVSFIYKNWAVKYSYCHISFVCFQGVLAWRKTFWFNLLYAGV